MVSKWFDRFLTPRFEEVTNARLHGILDAEVQRQLAPLGFVVVSDLKWVRDRDAPIRQVFTFQKLKGGVFQPYWGVSLDFVPHISGKQVRWHRSTKAALLDLCVAPQGRALYMSFIDGEGPVRRQHSQIVSKSIGRAKDFWARCETVAALPDAMAWLKAYYDGSDGLGFENYTQHNLSTAFVLAREGRHDEALAELERRYSDLWPAEVWQRLRGMVSAGTKPSEG